MSQAYIARNIELAKLSCLDRVAYCISTTVPLHDQHGICTRQSVDDVLTVQILMKTDCANKGNPETSQ